ncbi:MAG: VWA domain-containing protein, partial [Planctomycetes bacterium]|nr:VWA domain-containing protein [Planctomycetota bacterium]
MDLRHPAALLIALPLVLLTFVAAWRSAAGLSPRRFKVGLALRVFVILALALVAAEIRTVLPHRERSVVYVIDVSASVGASGRRQAQDWVTRSWEERERDDLGGVVVVGATARSEQTLGRELERRELDLDGVGLDRSSLERGLRLAGGLLRQAPGERRIVLLSDGNASDPDAASREARALASAGVRLDTVAIPLEPSPGEVLLGEVEAPSIVSEDEPFLLSVEIEALRAGPATLHIVRNGQYLTPLIQQLEAGLNRVTLAQRLKAADVYTYSLWIAAEGDGTEANDRGGVIVRVRGRSRILLVIGDAEPKLGKDLGRPLARHLEAAGFEVVLRGPDGLPLDLEELTAFDALVFGNVSADRWSTTQMDLVRRYVFEQGGGLLALGGAHSFGLGGYYKTPIEAALPLSSDVRRKKVLPSLGLVLCIDRSGSMSGAVDDTTKLALAKEGAVRCVDLLQPFDQVGVIGFGSDVTWATRIRRVEQRSRVKGAIRRINASGGTNIGGALDELCDELSKVPTKLRHAVLLTDGQSGEDQGDVMRLTRRFRKARITLTTVGVGNDIDQNLLQDLAAGTGGRFIHAADARTLPRLLSQEAVAASQALLIEREQYARHRGGLEELGIDWSEAPPLLGYVLTDARDEAEVLLDTGGGEEAEDGPLLARWRYGLGKSAAFASDGTARWSRRWLEWPEGARLFGSIVRWVARDPQAPGFATHLELSEGVGRLSVEARRPDGAPQSGLVLGASLTGPVGAP